MENFKKTFDLLAQKASVVEHRKDEFEAKLDAFVNRPDLTALLQKNGLDSLPFILAGMTIEGCFVYGTGINFFVANGYPPEGMDFFIRNHEGYCKIIMSCCLMTKSTADGQITLVRMCSDEDVLNREKAEAVMDTFVRYRHGLHVSKLRLAKIKFNDFPVKLCWYMIFVTVDTQKTFYLLADVDSGSLFVAEENQIGVCTDVPSAKQALSSPFSAYLYDGCRLLRDEHSRSNGGVGIFFG